MNGKKFDQSSAKLFEQIAKASGKQNFHFMIIWREFLSQY